MLEALGLEVVMAHRFGVEGPVGSRGFERATGPPSSVHVNELPCSSSRVLGWQGSGNPHRHRSFRDKGSFIWNPSRQKEPLQKPFMNAVETCKGVASLLRL